MADPVPVRHADHGPGIVCRPAFGHGLCEPLEDDLDAYLTEALADPGFAREYAEAAARARNGWPAPLCINGAEYHRRQRNRKRRQGMR